MIRYALLLLLVATCFTSGCRKKRGQGGDSSPSGSDPAAVGTGSQQSSAAPVVQPGIPIPKEQPWSERSAREKHDTYIFWLSQLKGADAARQAPILVKIRAAGLSAADKAELEKLRQLYGVSPLAL